MAGRSISKEWKKAGNPYHPDFRIEKPGSGRSHHQSRSDGPEKEIPEKRDFCSGDVHRAIHSTAHLIEEEARSHGVALKFASIKLIEGDEKMMKELEIQEPEQDIIHHIVDDMEFHCGMDREAALADLPVSIHRKALFRAGGEAS